MKNKFKKALALVICACMLIGGCSNQEELLSSDNTQSSTASLSDVSGTSDIADASDTYSGIADTSEAVSGNDESRAETAGSSSSEEKPAESVPEQENPFAVEWKLSNTWNDGDNYCGGYDVVITNRSGRDIEGWTANITVPDGFKLSSQWNGSFEVNGTVLKVTNEAYNGSIPANGTVSFGFNYSSPSEFKPSDVTVNGEQSSSSTSTGDSKPQSTPESSQTSKPAETVPVVIKPDPEGTSHVSTHGQLSVKGTQLVDKNGKPYQLRGMSTHGIGWFPDFVNEQAFKTLRDDWNTNVVRLAMYSGESEGYSGAGKQTYENLVKKGVEICIKLDMYVIIDWHVLADQSPQVMKKDALRFFDEFSKLYGKYPNVIYEICNEPNGYASWEGDVVPYAEEVIPVIRKNDPDSVIIVGTPTWSQDIDKALNKPLKFDNVMYALHFYAATHTDWLRDRLASCNAAGLPVMVTEFGLCDASGNGANDFNQSLKWLNMLDNLGISYMNWNLANKAESSSAFRPSAGSGGGWTEDDLSEGGAWIRKWFRGEIQ